MGLIEQHLYEDPLPPGLFAAGIPDSVDDLLLHMLAKDPVLRPSISEVQAVLQPLTPSVGSPEPCSRLPWDPTGPSRLPRVRSAARRLSVPAPAVPKAEDEWLDARAVERLCDEARHEIRSGKPGDAVRRRGELADKAREEWGSRPPLLRQIWELAAEGSYLAGDCGAAARFYRGAADVLVHGEGPQERADRAVLRLRVARCRLEFGEIEASIHAVDEAGHVAAGLPAPLAAWVEDVRREVDGNITGRLIDPTP